VCDVCVLKVSMAISQLML